MEDWQEEQIRQNLDRLIKLTSCNIELLSKLTSFLSEDDEATLEAKLKSDGILAHAALFYKIAIIKAGMYEALTKALLQTKQTAPFQILLEGTIKNQANIHLEGIPEEILLNALNGFHKNAVAGVVTFQGQQLRLKEVLEILDENTTENFVTKHLNGKLLTEIISNKKPALVNNGVPDQLSYFIDRKIDSDHHLNAATLFTQFCNDVFVVQGIERQKLTNLAIGRETDVSGNQIRRLTVRFIVLEYEPDFEKICALSRAPVHWIKFSNNTFNWIKSHGSIKNVRKHVSATPETLSLHQIISSKNKIVILADSPGMGKTVLMAKIAEHIMKTRPRHLVRFLVLKEFVQALNKKQINLDSIAALIAEQSSTFELGRKLVENIVKSGNCILMFDGFDEVLLHQTSTALQILQEVATLKSTQIFVTTRRNQREKLEDGLNTLGFTIQPFSKSDQVDFLHKFWLSKGISFNPSVGQFAFSCFNALTQNMTDFEREITGIPLQCKMLAETYIDEAERCSQLGFQTYEGPHSNTLVTSIFQMYQTHMKMRLERVEKSSKEEGLGSRFLRFVLQTKSQYDAIKDAHMYHALELLFPEDTDQFKHLLTSNSSLELGELCKYGILETTATDSTSSKIRFVHRTFAEYLVAWFLVEDENARCTSPEFKISRILSTHKAPKWKIEIPLLDPSEEPDFRNFLQHFRFDLPVVCYFINELTKTETEADAQLPQVSSLLYSTVYPHIAPVVCASAYHNHPHLLLAVYNFLPLPGEKTDNNQNEDMSSLLLIAANFADVELMKVFCNGIDVPKIDFLKAQKYSQEFAVTPLHVAVRRGHYNLVEFLINKFEGGFDKLQYLIPFCIHIYYGHKDDPVIISCKKQIIQLLGDKRKEWLDELYDDTSPILKVLVDLELLQCLIEKGADVNVYDNKGESVLHKIGHSTQTVTPESYHRFVEILIERKFKHFNLCTKMDGCTAIFGALRKLELLDETLQLFHSNGVDFNAADVHGNSLLCHAIKRRSVHLIKMLIEFGADWQHKNGRQDNVLHVCAEFTNFDAFKHFLFTYNMDINVVNEFGETPLHKCTRGMSMDCGNFQHLLVTNGANVNAKNRSFRTPILDGFRWFGLSLNIIQLMEQYGLVIEKTLSSNLLKLAICNLQIDFHPNFIDVPIYFIEKGGLLGSEVEENPWKFESVQNDMDKIIKSTEITDEFLNQEEIRNLLTEGELKTIQVSTGLDRSENFFKILKEKPDSFEIFFKNFISTSMNQVVAFETVRGSLSKHLGAHEIGAIINPRA